MAENISMVADDEDYELEFAKAIADVYLANADERAKDTQILSSITKEKGVVNTAEFPTFVGNALNALVNSAHRQEQILEKLMLIGAASAGLPIDKAMQDSDDQQEETPANPENPESATN